jgi:probable HAF family extracellular repeat protein
MFSGRITLIGSLVLLAQSVWTPARGADYVFKTFDSPGGPFWIATGINAAGLVVGFYSDLQTGREHGFLRSTDGTITTIDVPGATDTRALGINNAGQIVGGSFGPNFSFLGFVRGVNGKLTTFDFPDDWRGALANAINDAGEIVGTYAFPDSHHVLHRRGFVRDRRGNYTTLLVPGSSDTLASGINNHGQVSGYFNDAGGAHGFVLERDGTLTVFD